MILLASTMDGLDLSRSRVMVAAVQSLAFYCFPLLTSLSSYLCLGCVL